MDAVWFQLAETASPSCLVRPSPAHALEIRCHSGRAGRPISAEEDGVMLACDDLTSFYGASQALFGMECRRRCRRSSDPLMGRTAVGKTTTVNAIMGLLANAGRRRGVRGARFTTLPSFPHPPASDGAVARGRHIFPNLSVRREPFLASGREPARRRGNPGPSSAPSAFFSAASPAPRNMGNHLSGGEAADLWRRRALMTNPKLLILDRRPKGWRPDPSGDLVVALDG